MDVAQWKGKTAILRVDANVPLHNGVITDDTRLRRLLPGLTRLSDAGVKIVVLSHFGRPKGQPSPELSLAPVANALGALLPDIAVSFCHDTIGDNAKKAVSALKDGDIVMLENLRFHAEEEAGDDGFARQLAALGDIYINDAFSCAHRAHASIAAITQYLPAYFGESMQRELDMLASVFSAPKRPVAALVGGSKVSTKMEVLHHLVDSVDILMIGGGMANTFLAAQGHDVGASLCEHDLTASATDVLRKAEASGCRIMLPVDVAVASEFAAHAPSTIVSVDAIPADGMALDIGPQTTIEWASALAEARTLIWNGPAGAFEITPFDNSSLFLARIIAAYTQAGQLVSVAGGGDTVSALARAGLSDQLTYLSTAGGAFLEWMEGKTLPGVAAIEHQAQRKAG